MVEVALRYKDKVIIMSLRSVDEPLFLYDPPENIWDACPSWVPSGQDTPVELIKTIEYRLIATIAGVPVFGPVDDAK